MVQGSAVLLDESKLAIKECRSLLEEVSTSCCMPDRSPKMTEAFNQMDNIVLNLDLARQETESVNKAIADIGHLGSIVGFLYATCCTVTREPLYQKMYKEMNDAHGKLWQFLGHSH